MLAIALPYPREASSPRSSRRLCWTRRCRSSASPPSRRTDYAHLQALAARHGYVCYISPGPVPGLSTLYWGPPVRVGLPQPALSVDLGPDTNVTGSPTVPRGRARARARSRVRCRTPGSAPSSRSRTVGSLRPPLAALPVWAVHQADVRTRQFRDTGLSARRRPWPARRSMTDRSVDCVTGEGSLDGGSVRRGAAARAGLVGVRGAGWSNDGLWYVQQVVHHVRPGSYTADFTLAREGYGATVPVVRV